MRNNDVHSQFEAYAASTPKDVAVRFGDQSISYQDLNARANRISHLLLQCGAGANIPVGICLRPSIDTPASMLGVLKAGAAILPLDPNEAAGDLLRELQDASAPLLITEKGLRDRLAGYGGQALVLGADEKVLAEQVEDNPSLATDPHDIACIVAGKGETAGITVTREELAADFTTGCATAILAALTTGHTLEINVT